MASSLENPVWLANMCVRTADRKQTQISALYGGKGGGVLGACAFRYISNAANQGPGHSQCTRTLIENLFL